MGEGFRQPGSTNPDIRASPKREQEKPADRRTPTADFLECVELPGVILHQVDIREATFTEQP